MDEEVYESRGTFTFAADGPDDGADDAIAQDQAWQETKRQWREEDRRRQERIVYMGQNRLVGKIAEALDAAFPPEEYGRGHGTGHTSPGDLVRQFLVKIDDGE